MTDFSFLLLLICFLLAFTFRRYIIFGIIAFHCFYISSFFLLIYKHTLGCWIKDNHKWWSDHLCWTFRYSFIKHKDSKEVNKEEKTIILLNHRTLADVWVHDKILDHSCMWLSRMLLALVFPLTWLLTCSQNQVWFFVRGGRGENLESLFQWLDKKFASKANLRTNLGIYPEGHRNQTNEPLELKKGMIKYAFTRKIKVQIAICRGHEDSFNEKKVALSFKRSNVIYYIDSPIEPTKFEFFEDFYDHISKRFAYCFRKIYPATSTTKELEMLKL